MNGIACVRSIKPHHVLCDTQSDEEALRVAHALMRKDPLDELTSEQQDIMWDCREALQVRGLG